MPIELPPPVVITAPAAHAAAVTPDEVYGPIDTEGAGEQQDQTRQECPQSSEDEIVVCAPVDNDQYRIGSVSAPPTVMEELDQAVRIKVGGVEFDPDARPDGTIGIGVRIRF